MNELGNDLYTGKTSFPFVGKRRTWFIIAAILVIACLRSAIVWRRSASPRERPARRAAEPFATEASTGARNCARPR
jgi:hypothetical protein